MRKRTRPAPSTLAAYLAATGQTQAAFAQRLAIRQSTVSRLVNGRRRPGRLMARRLHDATGIPLVALLYPEEAT